MNTTTNTTSTSTETNSAETTKMKNVIKREDLTVEIVRKRLTLDEATGYFYLNEDTKLGKVGDFAGSIRAADLYYSIVIAGTVYSGKMLAHFYKEGKWPEKTVAEKAPKEAKPHTPRTAPVITPEAIEAAKKAAADKKAALKAKKEAEGTKAEASKEAADKPAAQQSMIEDADF